MLASNRLNTELDYGSLSLFNNDAYAVVTAGTDENLSLVMPVESLDDYLETHLYFPGTYYSKNLFYQENGFSRCSYKKAEDGNWEFHMRYTAYGSQIGDMTAVLQLPKGAYEIEAKTQQDFITIDGSTVIISCPIEHQYRLPEFQFKISSRDLQKSPIINYQYDLANGDGYFMSEELQFKLPELYTTITTSGPIGQSALKAYGYSVQIQCPVDGFGWHVTAYGGSSPIYNGEKPAYVTRFSLTLPLGTSIGNHYLTVVVWNDEGDTVLYPDSLEVEENGAATLTKALPKGTANYSDAYTPASAGEVKFTVTYQKYAFNGSYFEALDNETVTVSKTLTVADTALDAAKADAKAVLDSYKNAADYRAAQQTELENAINDGKTAIDAATSTDDVATALANAKAAIDAIKTDAELTAEETLAADKAAADAAQAKIAAIGTVEYTAACKARIDDAQAAFDALTAAQKDLVENKDVLAAAQTRYAALKAEAEQPTEPDEPTEPTEPTMPTEPETPAKSGDRLYNILSAVMEIVKFIFLKLIPFIISLT